MPSDQTTPGAAASDADELSPAELARLDALPSGAVALAGTAVALLLVAWVLIYLLIYLPRGMIG